MKKFFVFLWVSLFVFYNTFGQKRADYFSNLDKNEITTGVLYDIAVPLSGISGYTGSAESKVSDAIVWKQIYYEIRTASFDKSSLPDIKDLVSTYNKFNRTKVYPIAILDYQYNQIRKDAQEKGLIGFDSTKIKFYETGKGNPYETKEVFVASVPLKKLYGRKQLIFELSPEFYFSNKDKQISYFLVDFGDGKGVQKLHFGDKYEANYTESGLKHISLTAVYEDGSKKISNFEVNFKDVKMPEPDIYWEKFVSKYDWNGIKPDGDVAIFLGDGNTTLEEPVIVMDGFDPGDARPIEDLYDLANQNGMLDSLRSFGMDAVLINSHYGATYIQANAMLLTTLIETVNFIMGKNKTLKDANQIVVIGPSMAGLISRYAIRYMEQNAMHPNVRVWISFDSPQKGAIIPLGLQHWVRFFADVAGSEAAQEAKDALNTPAARQMLIYHFEGTDGTTANCHPWRNDFVTELNNMGFPVTTRKVSIIDGSGYGVGQPFDDGEQLIYYHYRSWQVDLDGNVWAVPDHYNTQIFEGLYDTALPFDETHDDVYVDNTDPYDNAPGGYVNTLEEMDNIDPGYGDIIAYYDNHSFIPTISSLAIENYTDPHLNVDENIDNIVTPFDKIYYPHDNYFHVVITKEMYWWFKHEVYNYPPKIISVPDTAVFEDSPYSYQVQAIDSNEWNTLNYFVLEKPAWLEFDPATHTFSGTPENDDVGYHTVKVMVTDSLKADTQEFVIKVINTNDPPFTAGTLEDQTIQAEEYFIYSYPEDLFQDVDPNDVLTVTARLQDGTQLPDWLIFNPDIHSFYGEPTVADTGLYTITLTATDQAGESTTASFNINVIYAIPYFTTTPQETVYEDNDYSYTFHATDKYNNPITYQIIDKPAWLNLDEQNNTLYGTPTNDNLGQNHIVIAAQNQYTTTYQDFYLTVLNTNDEPVYNGLLQDQTVYVDSFLMYVFPENAFSDKDPGDHLVYDAFDDEGSLPLWLRFDNQNRIFYGVPAEQDTGKVLIYVTATDDSLATDTGTFYINVLFSPDNPALVGTKPVSVYPVPANDFVFVTATGTISSLQMISSDGKLLYSATPNSSTANIDLSGYQSGVYILKITTGERVFLKQIIKQ